MKRAQKTQDMRVKKEKFQRQQFTQLLPKNDAQNRLLEALKYSTLITAHGSAGTGKAQPLHSKILTPDGWVEMRDVKVGDVVRSIDTWTKVTGVYPQGKKKTVRFKLNDGTFVEACTEHIWTVGIRKLKCKTEEFNLTSQEIIEKLKTKKVKIKLPKLQPVDFKDQDFFISPYVMGCLIGDGSITTGTPTLTSNDSEIFQRIEHEMGKDFNFTITNRISKGLTDSESNWKVKNRITANLIELGLHGKTSYDKFIPNSYKISSVDQRYDLLQGLMDTDGTVDHRNGTTSFCTTSKQLAMDVQEIILSLGGRSSISCSEKYFTYKGEKKKGATAYIVSINIEDKSKLFSLERKKKLVSKTSIDQLRRTIVDFEYLEDQECQCISVDHPSKLYVTDNYVLTHNTFIACWHAAKRLHYGDVKKIVLIRAYQPLAGRSIGFLPGELEDKLKPYYQQMLDYFEDFLGAATVEIALKNKTIEICSLETIRGRSWEDTIVIVDESQSLFIPEVQALVTRMGENSQLIFCGDDSGVQTDVKVGMDGLNYLKEVIKKYNIADTAFVKFTRDDIVRSGLTKEFVIAFEEEMITNTPIVDQTQINKQFKNKN